MKSDKQNSIQRLLLISFLCIGVAMGLIFPLYANFFVDWKTGMFVYFLAGCIVAGIVVGVINYLIVRQVLLTRLMNITHFAKSISDGDISKRCDINSSGEIGEIIESLNNMAAQLENSISQVANDSKQLYDSADTMKKVTANTKAGLSDQQNAVQKVVESVNELTSSVKNVSDSAKEASTAAENAHKETETGNQVLSKTINSIHNVAKEVERTANVIHDLEKDSVQIGKVLEVIQAIAEQTNLLALNAAIEAARAGDMGRGFAVVADEVRTLAQRTQESTQEIRQVIEHLQDGTKNAVKAMENSQMLTNESVEHAAKAGDSINAIAQSVEKIADANSEIVREIDEQNLIAEHTNRRTDEIKKLTQKSAENINDTDGASSQLISLAKSLQKVLQHFRILN